jgi:hypothetical protein
MTPRLPDDWLGRNSAVRPTNSGGLFLPNHASGAAVPLTAEKRQLRAHGGHLLGALDFLKEDNAHPALKSVREMNQSFKFGFDT